MVKPFRSFFLSFTIVAILLFSAMRTTPAYADDGDGTDTDTTETQTTDSSDGDESSETSTEADQGQTEETASSSEEGTVEEQSVGEIMDQVPDNTTVTVLNSDGEPLPLASQESADMIQSDYDPIWCPEGTPPVPGADGCTQSFSSFTELLTYLQANETDTVYQQAGTIYVQKDQYLGGESEINFNNYNFNEINKHNLTLQGGWNTADNTVNPADTTQFSVPITIGSGTNPWIGSLTLNNISISGVSNQTGLSLYTQSDITLSQVEVTNSQTGANLDAGGDVTINNSKFDKNKEANARVKAGGKVEITNSTFNDSEGMGVEINGGGNVSLASVTANNNGQFGANIQALGDVTIINSFFSGNKSTSIVSCPGGGSGGDDDDKDDENKDDDDNDSSDDRNNDDDHLRDAKYSSKSDDKDEGRDSSKDDDDDDKDSSKDDDDDDDNGTTCNTGSTTSGYGLQVVTSGSIALDAVSASDNNLFGAHLEGTDVAISNSSFNNNGSGTGSEPTGKGLEIIASASSTGTGTGSVSLFNVEANNNQLFGANIQATGSVAIGGISFFSGNKSTSIVSCPGGGNGGDGDNDDEKKDDDDKDSSSNDDDKSSDNDRDRDAKYSSKGEDKDDDKDSSKDDDDDKDKEKKDDDDDDGGGTTCNTGTTSSGYGLQVVTTGFVSLDGVTASDNNLFGAHLEGANVAISNSSFNNNGSGTGNEPTGKGLEIISGSDVSLSNVEASNNQLFGANIQALGSVSISNSFFSGNKSTSIVSCPGGGSGGDDDDKDDEKKDDDDKDSSSNDDDKNRDNDRDRDAKYSSKGDDKDDDKDSSKDDDDDDKDSSKDDDDDDNGTTCNTGSTLNGYGLQVVTTGPISLNAVSASDNNLFGAHLEGTDIAISNSSFNNNGSGAGNEPVGKGLEIISTGFVSLFNVEANNNQLFGANIQSTGDVIIGNSFFSGNKSTNIVSCPGGGSGGDDDDNDDEKKDDDDKGSSDDDDKSRDNDRERDAKYSSKSDDKDDDKDSSKDDDDDKESSKDDDDDKDSSKDDDDDGDGDGGGGGTPCNPGTTVTGYGLQVVTTGIISLDGVTASDNGVNGAILNSPSDITVTNSTFEGNGGTGLVISTTSGQVTLDNVTAANNGVDGVDVTGVCTTTVELIGGMYADNAQYGLRITNATLIQSGAPVVFINNGVGAVFQDPGTCITSTPPATGSSTAGGQGLTSKVYSSKVAEHPAYYRVNNNNLSLLDAVQTFRSSHLFASKTRPYKYTGGLLH